MQPSNTISSLLTIPVYRMILDAPSFAWENNVGKDILSLINDLPNLDKANYSLQLEGKTEEQQINFYNKLLLLSSKSFCRNMLLNIKADDEKAFETLKENDLPAILLIIEQYRFPFLQWLVVKHIDMHNLRTRYLEDEVKNAASIDEIIGYLKTNRVIKRLVIHLSLQLRFYI